MEASTQAKLVKIQTLQKELQMEVSAEEQVNSSGFIKKVVLYSDMEKYPEDPALVVSNAPSSTETIQVPPGNSTTTDDLVFSVQQ